MGAQENARTVQSIYEAFGIHDFQVRDVMAGARQVAVEVEVDVTPPGGTRYRDQHLHLWTFGDDGLVAGWRNYVDTAKHAAAWT